MLKNWNITFILIKKDKCGTFYVFLYQVYRFLLRELAEKIYDVTILLFVLYTDYRMFPVVSVSLNYLN